MSLLAAWTPTTASCTNARGDALAATLKEAEAHDLNVAHEDGNALTVRVQVTVVAENRDTTMLGKDERICAYFGWNAVRLRRCQERPQRVPHHRCRLPGQLGRNGSFPPPFDAQSAPEYSLVITPRRPQGLAGLFCYLEA
jgi:hypothetical protein